MANMEASMPRFARMTSLFNRTSCLLGICLVFITGVLAAAEATVRDDSPASYTVVDGDTLWDIAGKFLEQPWLWPQVWQINPQIRNPDLIYPGDVIELAYENGVPVLRLGNNSGTGTSVSGSSANSRGLPTVKLSPRVRRDSIVSPIPTIPLDKIQAYTSNNYIVPASTLATAPYVLGERNGRRISSSGDEIMARGAWLEDVITYDVIRSGRDLKDPDSDMILGREAIYIGTATITSTNGSEAFMHLDTVEQEVRIGDFLLPREGSRLNTSFMPKPPDFAVDAAIVSIGSGRVMGGTYDTLILNKGNTSGLETGPVLTVHETDMQVSDTVGKANAWQKLKQAVGLDNSRQVTFPGEEVATVLIYKVFDNSSLALVLTSKKPVNVQDRVITPL